LTDGIRRRMAFLFIAAIMFSSVILETVAPSFVNLFIGAQLMMGFSLTSAANTAPMLVTEVAYPPYRASLPCPSLKLCYAIAVDLYW
jgi:predicted MFS family arabinose efflux permease